MVSGGQKGEPMNKLHAYYIVVNDKKGNLYHWEGAKKNINDEINLQGSIKKITKIDIKEENDKKMDV